MSALPSKADIDSCERHVRFVPKVDIATFIPNGTRTAPSLQYTFDRSDSDVFIGRWLVVIRERDRL